MKNKSKLVLGLSVLTAATIAAGATGTFAWFTTSRSASVTITNVTVVSNQSNLVVDIQNAKNDTGAVTGTTNKTLTSAATISDVSSANGLSFSQASFVPGVDNKLSKVTDVTGENGFYNQYWVTVTNSAVSGTGSDFDLYLGNGTSIAPATTAQKDKDLACWTRVAINECKTGKLNPLPTANSENVVNKTVFKSSISGSTGVVTAGKYLPNGIAAGSAYSTSLEDATIRTDAFAEVVTGDHSSSQFLGKVANGTTVTYLVSVWMEGTEALDQNSAKDGVATITLDFRGLDALE